MKYPQPEITYWLFATFTGIAKERRVCNKNTHRQYSWSVQDSKPMDKDVFDLATRFLVPEIQALLRLWLRNNGEDSRTIPEWMRRLFLSCFSGRKISFFFSQRWTQFGKNRFGDIDIPRIPREYEHNYAMLLRISAFTFLLFSSLSDFLQHLNLIIPNVLIISDDQEPTYVVVQVCSIPWTNSS